MSRSMPPVKTASPSTSAMATIEGTDKTALNSASPQSGHEAEESLHSDDRKRKKCRVAMTNFEAGSSQSRGPASCTTDGYPASSCERHRADIQKLARMLYEEEMRAVSKGMRERLSPESESYHAQLMGNSANTSTLSATSTTRKLATTTALCSTLSTCASIPVRGEQQARHAARFVVSSTSRAHQAEATFVEKVQRSATSHVCGSPPSEQVAEEESPDEVYRCSISADDLGDCPRITGDVDMGVAHVLFMYRLLVGAMAGRVHPRDVEFADKVAFQHIWLILDARAFSMVHHLLAERTNSWMYGKDRKRPTTWSELEGALLDIFTPTNALELATAKLFKMRQSPNQSVDSLYASFDSARHRFEFEVKRADRTINPLDVLYARLFEAALNPSLKRRQSGFIERPAKTVEEAVERARRYEVAMMYASRVERGSPGGQVSAMAHAGGHQGGAAHGRKKSRRKRRRTRRDDPSSACS